MKRCTIGNATVLLLLLLTFESVVAHDYTGVIQTFLGWQLNRIPEVKKFLMFDADKFPIEVKSSSTIPYFILVDSKGMEIERHSLVRRNRHEIEDLITSKGFKRFEV